MGGKSDGTKFLTFWLSYFFQQVKIVVSSFLVVEIMRSLWVESRRLRLEPENGDFFLWRA